MSTPSPLKRKSSSPKTPPSKRQRRQTKKFEFGDEIPRSASGKKSDPVEIAFDKGSYLAVRADGGKFYVCQALQNVTEKAVKAQKSFRIRWLEIDKVPNIFKVAYDDLLDPQTVIGEVNVRKVDKTTYRVEDGEVNRVHQLLKASEKGDDPLKLDRSLFEPLSKKRKVKEDDSPGSSEETPQNDKSKKKEKTTAVKKTMKQKEKKEAKPKREKAKKDAPVRKKRERKRKKKEESEQEESEEEQIQEPPPLRRVKSHIPKPSLARAATITLKKQQSLTSIQSLKRKATLMKRAKELKKKVISSKIKKAAAKGKVSKERKQRLKKPPKPKVDRTDPNRKLIPNEAVTVMEKDPLFESSEKVPFVSVKAHTKLLIRAVLLKDYKMLQEFLKDSQRIGQLEESRSLNVPESALHYAIKNEDHKAIKMLKEEIRGDYSKRHARASETRSVLRPESTGTYNWRSLGIRKIRKVQISRGGKEGNNALTKDLQHPDQEGWLDFAIKHQVSSATIDLLVAMGFANDWNLKSSIVNIVRSGNRKLAANLVEKGMKTMDCGFNALHKEVLAFNGKETLSMQLREASVKKNPSDNKKMTPIHCAAINPNSKYLEQLLAACPEYNIEDEDKWRPIHYAAVCEGTGPLEYLLKQGISAEEGNKEGLTPIILACQAGRHLIVDLLLKKAREREASVEVVNKKAGPGGVNRALKTSWCPIHFAVASGHIEVVKVLLDNGGDINRPLNATFSRATPLMIATQNGDLEMVKFLVSRKAKIEMLDKLKRTAVAYACVDGCANVLSFLLSKGSNPNNTDTSGNSALHYACAYGWYFCVKLLLDAGAKPDPYNDWKLTPMGAAYLKGHHGLARFMLDIPEVNVDFQDEQGMTVLMRALDECPMTDEVYDEVRYLIKERGADPNLCDKQGRNAFHHLINNSLPTVYKDDYEELCGEKLDESGKERRNRERLIRKEAEKTSTKIADLLFEVNCDVTARDNNKATVTYIMIQQNADNCNLELLKRILELTGEVPEDTDKGEKGKELRTTILHTLAQNMGESKRQDLLYFIAKLPLKSGGTGISVLKKMARVRDHNRYTPFIAACDRYTSLHVEYRWSSKIKKQRRKQWKDFLTFLIKDLESELEYQLDVKDSEGKVIRKDWRSSMFYAIDAMNRKNSGFFDFLLKFNAKYDLPMANNQTKLIQYAKSGSLDVVKKLLSVGADVNRKYFDESLGNMTPLLAVMKEGRNISDMVFLLISNGADVNAERHDTRLGKEVRESALHIAVTRHSNAAVAGISTINMADISFASPETPHRRRIVKEDEDEENEDASSPLQFSHVVHGDMIPVVAMLLKAGVSLDVQDRRGCTALHILADKSTDNADESKDLEQMLIKRGANLFLKDDLGRFPVHYLFTKLTTANASRNEITGQMDPVESFSIFASAMKYQQLDVVDECGRSPLHYAACRGATVCCMLLVQKGCDVNRKDKEDNMPLSLCVRYHHDSCALTLMQKGADINGDIITDPDADKPPKEKENSQETEEALMNGTAQDSDDDSDDDDYWSDMDQDSDDSDYERRPSKKSAAKKKGLLTVEEVRKRIRNKKVRDPIKWKPRHYPSPWKPRPRGHPIFQGIVQNGWQGLTFIAMDLLEPFGMHYASAVEIAIKISKYRFALTLMNKQMDDEKLRVCNSEKQNLLHTLASTATSNNWELQKRIAEDLLVERSVPLNDVDSNGITAVEYSILQKNWDLVRLLLARPGVKVTTKDKYNRTCITALMWGMPQLRDDSSRNDPVKETLGKLATGADVNELFDFPPVDTFRGGFRAEIHPEDYFQSFPHTHKTTCLIQAICHSKYYIAVELLRNGADVNVSASNGMTPLMYAATLNDSVTVEILLQNIKDGDDLFDYLKKKSLTDHQIMEKKIKNPEATLNDPLKGLKVERSDYQGDINALDKDGKTVFHHLVTSLPTGSFENIKLLKKLSDVKGADWNIKDKAGLTPLDHAVKRGAHWMVAGLQQLSSVKPKMTKKISVGAKGFSQKEPVLKKWVVNDGIKWEEAAPDFVADAEEMLSQLEEEEMDTTEDDTKPDHRASIRDGYVVKDKEQDVLYDILMTKVDVRIGEWGLYNFYKMQVVYDSEKKMNILFTCWGRIGDHGQYQRTPYGTEEEACQEFAKIFKAKSGNEWANIKNFEIQPKKYRLVEAKYRKKNVLPDVKFDLDSKLPSKLNPYLQEVVKELSNVSMLRSQVSRTGIAVPFGRLKREQLQNALDILQQLRPLAKEKQELQNNLTTETLEEYRGVCEKLSELSSEYYFIVPQQGYQYEKLVPLDSEHSITRQIQGIFSLMDLETAGKLLLASQLRVKELNPLDYIYHALRINLQVVEEKDPMLKIIMRYIYSTSNVDVEAVYAVTREGEDERIEQTKLDNHKLLWHGSRTSNLISIFHKGLLIAPDEAASLTGAAFGKGIYSADTFQKSEGYCYNDAGGRSKYMLLCEVALGKEARYEYVPPGIDLPPEGYDSLKGNARQTPNPEFDAAVPTGVTVPLGTLVENREPYGFLPKDYNTPYGNRSVRCFGFNEFIVYKEDQIALRYIVQYR